MCMTSRATPMPTSRWAPWAPFLKGLLGGILGIGLVVVALHLWADHVALHQIITYINQAAAQQSGQPSGQASPQAPKKP
jgi:hypothetical protein